MAGCRLDRCTSVDLENMILEFDTQRGGFDYESNEKKLQMQAKKIKLCNFPHSGKIYFGGKFWREFQIAQT